MTERLDRIEATLETLAVKLDQSVRDSDARMTRLERQFSNQSTVTGQRIERLEQLMVALAEDTIDIKQNTAQLKRAVDYLMSRDGGQV